MIMDTQLKMHVTWRGDAESRSPHAILEPTKWPLELLFEELLGTDVRLMEQFNTLVAGAPRTDIIWEHALVYAKFESQDSIIVGDPLSSLPEVQIPRDLLATLITQWRYSVVAHDK
jgi:hypothetical protein